MQLFYWRHKEQWRRCYTNCRWWWWWWCVCR